MWTGDMHNGYPTQWALNPSAYQNMPNESVDWATLAQQWIQMKETFPVDQVPPAPPPPSIKGEVPTTGSDEAILAANASSNSQDGMQWGGWQQWDWSSNSSYVAPATFDYNHGATNAVPVTENYDQGYWSSNQIPAPHGREGRSADWRGADAGRSQSSRRQQAQRPDELVEFQSDSVAMIDAAKRKQLPAWIREGLEKMEREKQKKLEKERQLKEHEQEMLRRKQEEEAALASGIPVKSKFETDSEESGKEEDNRPEEEELSKKPRRSRFDAGPISPAPQPVAKIQSPTPTPLPPPVKHKTREEIMQDVMQQVKYMLTDILMMVTNEEMQKIAEESLADFRAKAPVTQLRKTPALTSLTSKLGLGIYDSEESSEESEPEPDRSNGIDSDEELRERIIRKKQEFERIERDIENEVEQQEQRERERERFEREAEEENEPETAAQVQPKLSPPGYRPDVKTEEPKITFVPKAEPEIESYTPERHQSYTKEKSSSEEQTDESDKSSSSSDSSSSSSSESKYRKSKRSRKKKEKQRSERKSKRSLSRGSDRRRTSIASGSKRHRSRSRSRSREYRRKRSRSRESYQSHSHSHSSHSHHHSHRRRHRSRSYSRSRSPEYRSHYSRGKKSSHRSRD